MAGNTIKMKDLPIAEPNKVSHLVGLDNQGQSVQVLNEQNELKTEVANLGQKVGELIGEDKTIQIQLGEQKAGGYYTTTGYAQAQRSYYFEPIDLSELIGNTCRCKIDFATSVSSSRIIYGLANSPTKEQITALKKDAVSESVSTTSLTKEFDFEPTEEYKYLVVSMSEANKDSVISITCHIVQDGEIPKIKTDIEKQATDIQAANTAISSLIRDVSLKIEDAPSDGEQYVRQDGAWVKNNPAVDAYTKEESDNRYLRAELMDEGTFMYGVEWGINQANPDVTRIGNMSLHKSLPIHNRMRGCLLQNDGTVTKYLNADTWEDEVTDGSMGQVMIELPEFWWKFETDGDTLRVKLALIPLYGYAHVPVRYVSAYEATVDRTTTTLCSVKNMDVRYRGGNNNADYDNTFRTMCGTPATAISMTNGRTYAKKRGDGWCQYTYDINKELYWLFVVEYATRNSQKAYNADLDSDGYKQGGLDSGVTNLNSTKWEDYNGRYPFVPCGYTDELGNNTGYVNYTFDEEQQAQYGGAVTTPVIRYRGIENPFGHVNKWADGVLVEVHPDADGEGSKCYVADRVSDYASTITANYKYVGQEKRTDGYSKQIIFAEGGEILTEVSAEASATTYYCDYSYRSTPTTTAVRGVYFGGSASYGATAGFVFSYSIYAPSTTNTNLGFRLCFCPNN